jgi:hypothetical protein
MYSFILNMTGAECRKIKREYLIGLKLNPCSDCGQIFIQEAMTFDHRSNEKKLYNIYKLVQHPTANLDKLKLELIKCDLVCVGCHRNRSQRRLSEYVTVCPIHRPVRKIGCKRCYKCAHIARLRTERLNLIAEFKNKPCADCGKTYNRWQMDFDHTKDKIDNVSNLMGNKAAWHKVLAEIKKCEVVCCWCHVTRTVKRKQGIP